MTITTQIRATLVFLSLFPSLPGHAAARSVEAYYALPLAFEVNAGQTDERVDFLARGSGYVLFLEPSQAVLSLRRSADPRPAEQRVDAPPQAAAVLRMRLVGANPEAVASAVSPLPGRANYFVGRDPAGWRTGLALYREVHYREIYPGIDLVYYGNQRRLEYDFIVGAGVDPGAIRLSFEGGESLALDGRGDLVLTTAGGEIRLAKPVLYQQLGESRREVSGSYVMAGANTVGFEVGAYDPEHSLIIDPILVYSTFLGGSLNDATNDIDVDALGQAHVTGFTQSVDFPLANASDPSFNGGGDATGGDAFVTKLDASGTAALYSTYLGGQNDDSGLGIALDPSGQAYVGGSTRSTNFPTTAGAPDTTCGNCGPFPLPSDAFVTKLDGSGSVVYSTLLGGHSYESVSGIDVDSLGNAYVTGGIANGNSFCNFPVVNQFDNCANSYYDAFVTKVNPTGTAFLYSTTLGGSNDDYCGCDIEADDEGHAYVSGLSRSLNFPVTAGAFDTVCGTSSVQHVGIFDATATKIDTNASGAASLAYSTCVGGSSDDGANGIDNDPAGNVWLTGNTSSSNFPTLDAYDGSANGGADAFVVKLDPTASGAAQLLYGTYLGGSGSDSASDVAVDSVGEVHVVGATSSGDFPTETPLQLHQGGNDVFVTRLDPSLVGASQLLFSTYLGGCGSDTARRLALDLTGHVYVVGASSSGSFPTTLGVVQDTYAGNGDGLVAKISSVGPTLPLGDSCSDDDDLCNGPESCNPETGQCISGPAVVCLDDGNTCNGAESCDPRTGQCISGRLAEDGTVCDDGDPGTCPDSCSEGVCLGTPDADPDEIDDSVRLAKTPEDTTISWTDAGGPYNLYRGSLTPPATWAYDHVCFGEATSMSATDTETPSPGTLFYYLVSRKNTCGESVIGRDSEAQPIPNTSPCPPM